MDNKANLTRLMEKRGGRLRRNMEMRKSGSNGRGETILGSTTVRCGLRF